jgi:hypothetical protein
MNDLRDRLLTMQRENQGELTVEGSQPTTLGDAIGQLRGVSLPATSQQDSYDAEGPGLISPDASPHTQAFFAGQVLSPTAEGAADEKAREQWHLETSGRAEGSVFSFFLQCRFVASVFSCSVGVATWCSPWRRAHRHSSKRQSQEAGKYFVWVNPAESLEPSGKELLTAAEVPPPTLGLACTSTKAVMANGNGPALVGDQAEPEEEADPMVVQDHIEHDLLDDFQEPVAASVAPAWWGADAWRIASLPARRTPRVLHAGGGAGLVRSILTQEIYGKAKGLKP